MIQRSDSKRNAELDEFITPPGLIKACLETLWLDRTEKYYVLDPGCNLGQWGDELLKIYPNITLVGVEYMDVPKNPNYTCWIPNQDYLAWQPDVQFDWVIGNPPYSTTQPNGKRKVVVNHWIKKSLSLLKEDGYLGFLLRKGFNHNIRAWKTVLFDYPPMREFMLLPRPNFYGKHDPRTDGSSGAQWDYSWVLWDKKFRGDTRCTPLFWKGKPK